MKNLFIMLSLCLSLISCQNNSGGNGGGSDGTNQPFGQGKKDNKNGENSEGGGNRPTNPQSCEQQWKTIVGISKVGNLERKETRTFTLNGSTKNLNSKSQSLSKVIFNDGSKIVTLEESIQIFPQSNKSTEELTMLKEDFLRQCSNNELNADENQFEKTILGDENVTVKAGSFLCSHQKLKNKPGTDLNNQNMEIEIWLTKREPSVLVKSIQKIKMQVPEGEEIPPGFENMFGDMLIETELIELILK